MEEKNLYPYQKEAVKNILHELDKYEENVNVLFQLPTGGGKTIIFSEITRQYIEKKQKKVLILTHRIELCRQTSTVLDSINVPNKTITSDIRYLDDEDDFMCFTAMVETLNNRMEDDPEFLSNIGLVIVDEAHYNSFKKIFKYFEGVNILGVTATPLSSNKNLPLKHNYDHLVVGESISSLIEKGYLSKATTYTYDVQLKGLKIGVHGDYTVSSIEHLYSSALMQQKLIHAYQEISEGKKTLIFNAGIISSKAVEMMFKKAGFNIRHLDSTFTKQDRQEVLDWFRETPNAILTSVGILTTGFDEPSVETIILNRATRSLTLYHQMIGRGSRIYKDINKFTIIDLGNNAKRLGYWDDKINWHEVFLNPDKYLEQQIQIEKGLAELEFDYEMPPELQARFPKQPSEKAFAIKAVYRKHLEMGRSGKKAIDDSVENHAMMIKLNANDQYHGFELMDILQDEIEHRMHQYSKCVNGTDNYAIWLSENYTHKLRKRIRELYAEELIEE